MAENRRIFINILSFARIPVQSSSPIKSLEWATKGNIKWDFFIGDNLHESAYRAKGSHKIIEGYACIISSAAQAAGLGPAPIPFRPTTQPFRDGFFESELLIPVEIAANEGFITQLSKMNGALDEVRMGGGDRKIGREEIAKGKGQGLMR